MHSNFSEYENFYNDMDIAVRIQDCIFKAGKGDTSSWLFDEVSTIKEDLMLYPKEVGEKAQKVNDLFLQACDNLIDYIGHMRDGDTEKAQMAYENAQLRLNEGNMRYHDFVAENLR